jgi:hypothetical protein
MSEEDLKEELLKISEEDREPLRNFLMLFGYDIQHLIEKEKTNDHP